jgi:hypothetical protein
MGERFRRLSGLFDDMVELPGVDREEGTPASCAGDVALERELRALLAADESRNAEDGPCSG